MFTAYDASEDRVVLNFGTAPKESFSGLVEADDIPQYAALDTSSQPLKLSPTQEVPDDGKAIFQVLGLG